jgi:hypothetical protein
MSIVVKYKLVGSSEFQELSLSYEDVVVSFSTDGVITVGNNRRFLSMFRITNKLENHLNPIKSANDITHIEVVDNCEENSTLFEVFKATPGNDETQNLICLDYCEKNRTEGGDDNSYFYMGKFSKLQSFVCNYPCLFSPYYSRCFKGSTTLTNVSLNLQKETINSSVTIPDSTFDSSSIVSFESTEVTLVGDGAFRGCSKLKRVFLPKCTVIHNGVFYACSGLEYLSIPSITKIYNVQDVNYAVNYASNSLDEMTIGQTSLLKFLVLPSKNILLEDDQGQNIFTYSEVELLKFCVTKNNGTIKFVDDIDEYINFNTREVCHISILDIDCETEDIVAVNSSVIGSSVMTASCFQGITFNIDSDGKPYNFIFEVPVTPIPSLPMLPSNITIADDFINDTLDQMGLSVSSANADSIAKYKENLLTDINTKINALLTEQQDKIGETLFKFANNSDRVVLITDEGNITGGTLNMLLDDKIKFIIRLISGNGIAYDKSYEIVYSLQ